MLMCKGAHSRYRQCHEQNSGYGNQAHRQHRRDGAVFDQSSRKSGTENPREDAVMGGGTIQQRTHQRGTKTAAQLPHQEENRKVAGGAFFVAVGGVVRTHRMKRATA